MATLAVRLSDLITAIGTDYKLLVGRIGTLTSLSTTTKTSLVDAINEVNAKPSGTGGASINDAAASGTTTFSGNKINTDNQTQDAAIALKAPLANPAFTGTPTGITKTHVGLGNVDNTSDLNKPISTAETAALALKAPLASPAFTGTPTGITKTHVGLANVDNTSDVSKPVSTAQAAAILALINDAAATTDTTKTWSVKKTNDMIVAAINALTTGAPDALNTLDELSAALGDDANFAASMTTALGNRLKVDGTAQTIIAANQAVAIANLGAVASIAIGNPDADLVALYTTAKA